MTNFRNFDRHANMSMDSVSKLTDLISDLIFTDRDRSLDNKLYGLFDGYLYLDVPELISDINPHSNTEKAKFIDDINVFKSELLSIYRECENYPEI